MTYVSFSKLTKWRNTWNYNTNFDPLTSWKMISVHVIGSAAFRWKFESSGCFQTLRWGEVTWRIIKFLYKQVFWLYKSSIESPVKCNWNWMKSNYFCGELNRKCYCIHRIVQTWHRLTAICFNLLHSKQKYNYWNNIDKVFRQ